jgi:molybdopterin synthase catalytic subunit
VFLSTDPIDVAAFLEEARPSDGAVCTFVGVVRNESDGRPSVAVEYEAYGPMAESVMARIAESLADEFPQARVRIRHRVGRLADAAFAACRAAIERIKKEVPIWKKEIRTDGSSDWVDPTRRDTENRTRNT